jgi:hypothetical protein
MLPSDFARIPVAVATRPVKRTKLYQLARKHRGLFLKDGNTTIVNLRKLDKIIAQFPPAELKRAAEGNAA